MGKDLPGGILEILEQYQKTCLYRIGLAPGVINFDGRRVKYFSMTQEPWRWHPFRLRHAQHNQHAAPEKKSTRLTNPNVISSPMHNV